MKQHILVMLMLAIPFTIFCGVSVGQTQKKTNLAQLRKAAEAGDAQAQFDLAEAYDLAGDEGEAGDWYHKAALQGHVQARNKQVANFEQNRTMAEQGDAIAQHNLGVYYAEGRGIPKNQTEAVKWYRKAAVQGYAKAQCNLGAMYHKGEGVPQDMKEAVKWFRLAADQGNARAQYNMATTYSAAGDDRESVKWCRKSAEQGYAKAQFALGVCYAQGLGVEQNETEAAKWFHKAAVQGDAKAQFALGMCYAQGLVEQNEEEAFKWLDKAAKQGHEGAIQILKAAGYYR